MKFETERLIVRKPELTDANDIFNNYTQDREVTKYLGWKPHTDIKQTEGWLKHCISSWDENKNISFIIWHKNSKQAIGMIDLRIDDFKVDFGYVLAKDYWGSGLMLEACDPIIQNLSSRINIHRIQAIHDIENSASGRVMEKLGLEYEGVVKKYSLHPNISEIPRDCKLYALTM